MAAISITERTTTVEVKSPYHPEFAPAARGLGGKWDAARALWVFDVRDARAVRDLVRRIYGSDGSQVEPLVSLLVRVDTLRDDSQWFIAGRAVAQRLGRDAAVRLGEGVTLVSGGFAGSGGSAKYPRLSARENTVLRVRDVPLPAAQDAVQRFAGCVTIEQDATTSAAARETLLARRDALTRELAEIEAQLAMLEQ